MTQSRTHRARAGRNQRLATALCFTGLALGVVALPLLSLLGLAFGWFTVNAWIAAMAVLALAAVPPGFWVADHLPGNQSDPTFGWGGEVR